MITRSKDGIYKPKALHAKVATPPSAPSAAATPSASTKCAKFGPLQCSKPTNSGSSSKPNYTTTEPPTYKIAAQFPQWCSTMNDEFTALQMQGT